MTLNSIGQTTVSDIVAAAPTTLTDLLTTQVQIPVFLLAPLLFLSLWSSNRLIAGGK